MKGEWSLKQLYQGYKDPAFQTDMKKAKELVEKIQKFSSELYEPQLQAVKEGLLLLEEKETIFEKLYCYAMLKQSANTKDEESVSVIGKLNDMESNMTKAITSFKKYVASINKLENWIASDDLLGEYSYYLTKMKEDSKYLLSEEVEEVMAKFDLSGGSSWGDLQSFLTSTIKEEFRGEEKTLTELRNMAYDKDKQVREAAYYAELSCYTKIEDSVAFALNSIKLQVLNESRMRGFSSPLEQTLYESHMSKATLEALLDAIKEYLPMFQEYLQIKAQALGYQNGLPWYELFTTMGSSHKTYTVEEAKDFLLEIFDGFAPDLAQMVKQAFEEEWIDFYPREGKVGGAFCESIHAIKESRILTNFAGSVGDVVTLAHELGHAYHNYNLNENRPLNIEYSMPVAETASTFNENIVMNAVIQKEKKEEELLALVEHQLQDVTQIIVDIYSRYLFETKVFEERGEGFLFADKLCEYMLDSQRAAYGKGLDDEMLHPYMWVCKSHYYSSSESFYNFPYAFGGLFARGLYEKYKEEGEAFLPKYKKMLNATTIMSVEEVAKIMEIDLTDKEFWQQGLASYREQIDLFKNLVEKK